MRESRIKVIACIEDPDEMSQILTALKNKGAMVMLMVIIVAVPFTLPVFIMQPYSLILLPLTCAAPVLAVEVDE